MLTISSASKEYVRVLVRAWDSGSQVDPTSLTVQMAFLPPTTSTPSTGDWKTASWETDSTTTPTSYYARCLVGTAVTLTAGVYTVWVKVSGSPEVPVLRAGELQVI